MAEYSDKYMMESLTGDSALRQISEIRKSPIVKSN